MILSVPNSVCSLETESSTEGSVRRKVIKDDVTLGGGEPETSGKQDGWN